MKKQLLIMAGIAIAILGIGLLLFNSDSNSNTSNNEPMVHPDSYTLGSESAKVTIKEFADFQCPACAAATPIVKQLSQDYFDQIKIVFRHFPLQQHRNGMPAAYAAEAAGEQGKFWEMYEMLYAKQSQWEA